MSDALKVISYGFGTVVGLMLAGLIVFWFIQDVTQKKHSICVTIRSSVVCDFSWRTGRIFSPIYFFQ
jgi:sulfite exporter TauE/SafE